MDWNLFIDLQPRDSADITRTQLAYRIDTSLVNGLGVLPASVASNPNILALRNLQRGWRMRLPSGHDIARAISWPEGRRILQPRCRFRKARILGFEATEAGRTPSPFTKDVSILYASWVRVMSAESRGWRSINRFQSIAQLEGNL